MDIKIAYELGVKVAMEMIKEGHTAIQSIIINHPAWAHGGPETKQEYHKAKIEILKDPEYKKYHKQIKNLFYDWENNKKPGSFYYDLPSHSSKQAALSPELLNNVLRSIGNKTSPYNLAKRVGEIKGRWLSKGKPSISGSGTGSNLERLLHGMGITNAPLGTRMNKALFEGIQAGI